MVHPLHLTEPLLLHLRLLMEHHLSEEMVDLEVIVDLLHHQVMEPHQVVDTALEGLEVTVL